jgi:hypothetical protein
MVIITSTKRAHPHQHSTGKRTQTPNLAEPTRIEVDPLPARPPTGAHIDGRAITAEYSDPPELATPPLLQLL